MPATSDPARDPWLYHFTHYDNLPNITRMGMLADNGAPPLVTECGEPDIKAKRRRRQVPLPPGGTVAEYVPFYFATRSPMLYRIHREGVPGFSGDQCELVYLVTRLSGIERHSCRWVATDRNAALDTTRFVSDVAGLRQHIDWPLMQAKMWNSVPDDRDRMQRRMAELLVHHAVPWAAISHLGVCSDATAEQIRSALDGAEQPSIIVRPSWYFLSRIGDRTDMKGGATT